MTNFYRWRTESVESGKDEKRGFWIQPVWGLSGVLSESQPILTSQTLPSDTSLTLPFFCPFASATWVLYATLGALMLYPSLSLLLNACSIE